MMKSKSVDVLIIGAGPTGTTLAIDLARRGLAVRIIERNAQSFSGSRAKGLQPRSLEVLEDLGALNDILAAGMQYPPMGLHLGPLTVPKRMYKAQAPTSDIPYPDTLLIPQFSTDKILHARLAQLGVVVEFDTALASFEQDDAEVRASVEHAGREETIFASFMVGADGGSSAVRRALAIQFPGTTVENDRMIIVDAKTPGLSRKYWHAWPGLSGTFVGACPLPSSELFQWMIRLKPSEEPALDEAALNARVRKQTGSSKLRLDDIQWTSVFRPNIRLAERYSSGRIFLAGDAAHVHTPAGAQGMNTGIQDAYNLGWKIAQVINGAPVTLLDSYEAERRPIAAAVLGLSTKKYEAIGKLDPSSMKRGQDEKQLRISYRGGPLASADQGASKTLFAGDRAPDAILRNTAGTTRLFDLLSGPQFTLLAYGPNAARDIKNLVWAYSGALLKTVTIGTGQGDSAGSDVVDDRGTFKANYGVTDDTFILVRPDGYIATIASQNRLATIKQSMVLLTPSANPQLP